MTLEKLEEIREKIAALGIFPSIHDPTYCAAIYRNDALSVLDAAIAEERAESANPEPLFEEGDAKAVFDCLKYHASAGGEYEYRGTLAIEAFQRIMRAAGVRRKIEEAGE